MSMKKHKKVLGILAMTACAVFLIAGCGKGEGKGSVKTFADWTGVTEFQEVPAMVVEGATIGEAADFGGGVYVIEVAKTKEADYKAYVKTVEEAGYKKIADNGEEGLGGGCVYTTNFKKDSLAVTVTHVAKKGITYVAAKENLEFSSHLQYDESYVADNKSDAKTTLYMPELHTYGNSFILQLKNGHFILEDGGMPQDAIYLIEFLESLVPEGEKPVIEAWFFSHGHSDHMGAISEFNNYPSYADRIIVEEVFYNMPSNAVMGAVATEVGRGVGGMQTLKNSEGKTPTMYRPQTGQRYYYNDITIDILHCQEQHLLANYENGFNDSSTWLMYTIEGQTFLSAGDAGDGSVAVVKDTYNQSFFDFDVMATFHHGQNIYESFVGYYKYKTVLYTTFSTGPQTANYHAAENARLQKRADECISWKDGGKVLTFPYVVGTYQSLPLQTWTYHPGYVNPKQPY